MIFYGENRFLVFILALAALTAAHLPAQSSEDPDKEVREAALESVKAEKVLNAIMKNPNTAIPQSVLAHAKAIAVFPQVIKAAFLVGGEGGRGVVSRRTQTGWSDPVFFRAGGGSVGPQIGASATDIVLLFMNEEAVRGLMKNKFELGAEAAVAGGPVGRAATLMEAEILSYSRSRGLFAGVNLQGVVIHPEDDLNFAVYDKSAHELLGPDKEAANNSVADLSSFSKTVSRYAAKSGTNQ